MLLDKFDLDKEYRPKDNHDCNEKVKIKRDEKWIGGVRETYKKLKDTRKIN